MRLLPESWRLRAAMKEAGYPYCLGIGDWCGKKPRHCNSCIKFYRKTLKGKLFKAGFTPSK